MSAQFYQFLRLSRIFDAMFPILSLFVGAAAVGAVGDERLLLLAIAVIGFNSVAMVWNDIEDRAIDADNGRTELSDSEPIDISRLAQYAALTTLIVIALTAIVSRDAVIIGAAAIIFTWAYNSKPIQASRRPLSSVIVLSGAGAFLPYLFGATLGDLTVKAVIAGVFWWIARISLSLLKDYKDAPGDRLHSKKTFLLRYGARWVARLSVLCLIIGYTGFIIAAGIEGRSVPIMLLLAIGLLFIIYRRRPLFESKATYVKFDKVFRSAIQYHAALETGIIIWLIY